MHWNFWMEGQEQSRCAAVEGVIHSKEPVSTSCDQCPESLPGVGGCKPGIRLYVLPLIKRRSRPMVFSISPSNIGLWREHQLRLARSGIPQIAVVTTFGLMDTQAEAYRWARVEPGRSSPNLSCIRRWMPALSLPRNFLASLRKIKNGKSAKSLKGAKNS